MARQVSRLAHQGVVRAVAFSPDGKWVATGSGDKTARVMEAATGKEVSRLAHQGVVNAVAFSPDGKWVATGSEDGTARVMEAATGKEVSRLAHHGDVSAVAFSPDGRWVATGSWDKTARVMEAATGKELVRHEMNGRVITVCFLGNSSLLLSVRLAYDVPLGPVSEIEISHVIIDPAELIPDACSRLPRNLTREEWGRYLPGEPYRSTCPNLPLEPKAP
jgi:WD40 repeat protein